MNNINIKLKELYESKEKIKNNFNKKCHNMHVPDLESEYVWQYFYCPDECLKYNKKLMFVGQESYGWEYIYDINKSMEFTNNFLHSDYNSVFWRFINEVSSIINIYSGFNKYNYFYSNIFRLCLDSNIKYLLKNNMLINEYLNNIQTLSEEIKIFNPDKLFFLTGPTYDTYLLNIFPGIEFNQVNNNYSIREFSRLSHKYLPYDTFRLYHPNYANRHKNRLWQPIIDIVTTE